MKRREFAVPVALAAIAVTYFAISLAYRHGPDPHEQWAVPIRIMYVCYIAAGLFGAYRRPKNPIGTMLLLTAVVLELPIGQNTRVPILWTIGSALEPAPIVMLAYLLLAFPQGKLGSRRDRVIVAMAAVPLAFSILGSFFYDPRAGGCLDCQRHLNLILIRYPPPLFVSWLWRSKIVWGAGIIALAGLVGEGLQRWLSVTRPMKRILAPIVLPATLLFSAVIGQQIVLPIRNFRTVFLLTSPAFSVLTNIATYAGMLLPLGFLLSLWLAWVRKGRVGELVVELDAVPPPDRLKRALSKALGDPSLEVGFWDSGRHAYMTANGSPFEMPEANSGRAVTFLERDGVPLAAVTHDPALLEDRALLDSVTAAARLAVDNERLQAEIRAQLEEVRASRARLVEAADAERRRLERDLHDGAQQRLVSLALDAKALATRVAGADADIRESVTAMANDLRTALNELRELAQGIHPLVLTEEGLGPAILSLAERSPVPARVLATPDERFPAPVEAAAYFVVSEALSNAAKHAEATEVTIEVRKANSRLVVGVTDNGHGGADPSKGTGLRGLTDRVAAVNGQLTVNSPQGKGTTVRAEIPIDTPATEVADVEGTDQPG